MNAARPLLCVIEDDPIMGESLCVRLELEGFAVEWYTNAEQARQAIHEKPCSLVISDIRLPDLGGNELFTQLQRELATLPPFIFITGFGAIDCAVILLKQGAADYITKPFDIEELVEKTRAIIRLYAKPTPLPRQALGVSVQMRRIEEMLPQIAKHANTVLFTGESGVGKEHVAMELDRMARDNEQCPFVAVNCGAITETLFESELFGHEKGAFTGALRTRRGYFEQAHCGTLFLDELSEMPLPMQVKLLRAIQERSVVRVGGEDTIDVDLRLFCATNRDLKELVAQGRFREDLYYRINVINIRIPPLRERPDDIIWFANLFLDEFARMPNASRHSLHISTQQAILEYPWPGNIRELKHTITRACILASGSVLMPEDLFGDNEEPLPLSVETRGTLEEHMRYCEEKYLSRMLETNKWHISNTAQALGISRKSLWEKMKRLDIHEPKF